MARLRSGGLHLLPSQGRDVYVNVKVKVGMITFSSEVKVGIFTLTVKLNVGVCIVFLPG